MKNKLADLADHLFAQLERLGAEDLKEPDQSRVEIQRAGAMASTAAQIIGVGRLALDAAKAQADMPDLNGMPALLGLDKRAGLQ